jgi:hypothetical protein
MIKFIRAALFVAALPLSAVAQDADQKAILSLVDRVFEGMRKGDTAMMRAAFAPQARMLGVGRDGQVTSESIDGWLTGIARPRANNAVIDERTWAPEVKIDGNIAQAWMQYALYVGERLNHCGVDAFDFLKVGGDWKILTVMDTRRTTGCTPPPARLP